MSAPLRHQAFTLIELLVVISIIAILAGMLLPAINLVRSQAQQANCGNNQRQIAMAMLAYRNDSDDLWPALYAGGKNNTVIPPGGVSLLTASSADILPYTAMVSFEFLGSSMGNELPAKTFACPSNAAVKPATPPASLSWTSGGTPTWAGAMSSAAMGTAQAYAYDFMTPSNASSSRAVLADRIKTVGTSTSQPGETNHRKKTMVAFADGHYETLTITGAALGGDTAIFSQTGAVAAYAQAINKNVGADECIYDDNGDRTSSTIWAMNAGNTSRAFVK